VDLGLNGCTAIVGGSSAGMGLATARSLAREGCNVALFARRQERLDAAVEEIGPEQALAVAGDSRSVADLERLVDATRDRFGGLDILVNNTGGAGGGGFDDLTDEDWQRGFEQTVLSALRTTRFALPLLRESRRGRVVNITSFTVQQPEPGLLLSNGLRPGVIGWARDLARQEATNGITVNSVAPGFFDTDRMRELYALADDPEQARRSDEGRVPMGRFGTAEEMADAITFLCSTRASYVTGATLLVDGGLLS
jgi:3-oxoacyl-[acyl-carrier protein] reductase